MGKTENKVYAMAKELEKRGFKTKYLDSPGQFYANALLTRELDNKLQVQTKGDIILIEHLWREPHAYCRMELNLGKFNGYIKGTVSDSWKGFGKGNEDGTIATNMGKGKQVIIEIEDAAIFSRFHAKINKTLVDAVTAANEKFNRTERSYNTGRIWLNPKKDFVWTGFEQITSRLKLVDEELLKYYLHQKK